MTIPTDILILLIITAGCFIVIYLFDRKLQKGKTKTTRKRWRPTPKVTFHKQKREDDIE